MFASLAEPNFRTYVAGAFVSNIGTWVQRVAQDWLVLQLSDNSPVAVGITTALQFLPALALSPVGGLLADRFDKRRLLIFTQSWMAVSSVVLGLLAVTGSASTGHVYLLAFVFGMGSALDVPARQSFVSEMVGAERLTNAIGLNSSAFNAARLIGPGVAGLIIAAFGSGWAILTNGVSYIAFLIALMLLDEARLVRSERLPRAKGQLREGFRYVTQRSDLVVALGVGFAVGTWGMNFQMTNVLMARNEFGLGATAYGVLGSVMGIGSLFGALLAARRRAAPSLRFVVVSASVFAVFLGISGLAPTAYVYAVCLPLLGLAALVTLTATNMYVQTSVDPQVRGRVMALYMTLLMGGTPIGSPLLGLLADHFGPRAPMVGGALLQAATIVIVVLVVRAMIARRGEHERQTPTTPSETSRSDSAAS
ncbi:MFS transporter [Gordonia sp. MP11Mi]